MGIFNYRLVHKDKLKQLQRSDIKLYKVVELHRWFSGWKDLDIIWNYIFGDTNFGGIQRARYDYAKARNTDEYGKQL